MAKHKKAVDSCLLLCLSLGLNPLNFAAQNQRDTRSAKRSSPCHSLSLSLSPSLSLSLFTLSSDKAQSAWTLIILTHCFKRMLERFSSLLYLFKDVPNAQDWFFKRMVNTDQKLLIFLLSVLSMDLTFPRQGNAQYDMIRLDTIRYAIRGPQWW